MCRAKCSNSKRKKGIKLINSRKTGAEYEAAAEEYLINSGYEILEKNYHNHYGEIDIIAREPNEDIIVYCEVKYRSSLRYGDPLEAVDYKKQKKISRVALYHHSFDRRAKGKTCRFDVIGIYGDKSIRHIKGAFEFLG